MTLVVRCGPLFEHDVHSHMTALRKTCNACFHLDKFACGGVLTAGVVMVTTMLDRTANPRRLATQLKQLQQAQVREIRWGRQLKQQLKVRGSWPYSFFHLHPQLAAYTLLAAYMLVDFCRCCGAASAFFMRSLKHLPRTSLLDVGLKAEKGSAVEEGAAPAACG